MVLPGGAATWTVLGPDHGVVGPAEEFLEYLRVQGMSPNTVKSYARALALWWTYLAVFGLGWDALTLADVGGFLAWRGAGGRLAARAARWHAAALGIAGGAGGRPCPSCRR